MEKKHIPMIALFWWVLSQAINCSYHKFSVACWSAIVRDSESWVHVCLHSMSKQWCDFFNYVYKVHVTKANIPIESNQRDGSMDHKYSYIFGYLHNTLWLCSVLPGYLEWWLDSNLHLVLFTQFKLNSVSVAYICVIWEVLNSCWVVVIPDQCWPVWAEHWLWLYVHTCIN